jgi:hypothetical protein
VERSADLDASDRVEYVEGRIQALEDDLERGKSACARAQPRKESQKE